VGLGAHPRGLSVPSSRQSLSDNEDFGRTARINKLNNTESQDF
jgi:hypothetical protein